MTHLIQRQYLEVEVNGTESDGMALQHRLPEFCQNHLLPAIERALDRCAPKDGHLFIDRLDIDVGSLSLDRLEDELGKLVAEAVEKALEDHLPVTGSSKGDREGPLRLKSEQTHVEEAFIYFLKTGSLPWSFQLPEGKNLEQVILETWQRDYREEVQRSVPIEKIVSILKSTVSRTRLTLQFSPVFLTSLLARISPRDSKVMPEILKILRSEGALKEIRGFVFELWDRSFASIVVGESISAKSLIKSVWQETKGQKERPKDLAQILEKNWPGVTQSATSEVSEETSPMPDTASTVPSSKGIISREEEDTPSLALDAAYDFYVENAGLVLLHPFIPRIFEGLEMAKDSEILKPERALSLLHHLATGQTRAPEYELILPKILCNIPLGQPVRTDVKLTKSEKEEAEALLTAVIRHWEALRNSTPDGLRGNFLLRSGKISVRDNGDWLLQIEPKTYDVLLDDLPWGIAMIKLPWMERMNACRMAVKSGHLINLKFREYENKLEKINHL